MKIETSVLDVPIDGDLTLTGLSDGLSDPGIISPIQVKPIRVPMAHYTIDASYTKTGGIPVMTSFDLDISIWPQLTSVDPQIHQHSS